MPAIDGLSSGLDTASIIKQLMQLERIPQSRLQSKQTATESSLGSLRTLNSKFNSMASAATALGATLPNAVPANPPKPSEWQLTRASSSDSARTAASAVAGAPAGTLTFHVQQLATASSSLSANYDGTTAPVAVNAEGAPLTSLVLTKGTTSTTIDTGDGSLAATVAAINKDKSLGVTASMVQMAAAVPTATPPTLAQYKLQLTSTTTGANSTVRLRTSSAADAQDLVPTVAVAGRDSVLDLGGGTTITRSSNTISDVMEGVTLTLSKADTRVLDANGTPTSPASYTGAPVTVTVQKDVDGIASRVQALVDAANAARSDAKSLTAMDPVSKAKGRLYGDSMVRGLVDEVRSTVPDALGKVAQAGVSVDRFGVISFDKATFLKALEADPAAVEAALGKNGMAGRMLTLGDAVSRGPAADGGPGRISNAIASKESQISSLKSNIESWDSRLAMKEKQLQRQYTSLETALGKAQSQGQWLSGQLANLPKWS
jgi:flagellar hook-associated protein 2